MTVWRFVWEGSEWNRLWVFSFSPSSPPSLNVLLSSRANGIWYPKTARSCLPSIFQPSRGYAPSLVLNIDSLHCVTFLTLRTVYGDIGTSETPLTRMIWSLCVVLFQHHLLESFLYPDWRLGKCKELICLSCRQSRKQSLQLESQSRSSR